MNFIFRSPLALTPFAFACALSAAACSQEEAAPVTDEGQNVTASDSGTTAAKAAGKPQKEEPCPRDSNGNLTDCKPQGPFAPRGEGERDGTELAQNPADTFENPEAAFRDAFKNGQGSSTPTTRPQPPRQPQPQPTTQPQPPRQPQPQPSCERPVIGKSPEGNPIYGPGCGAW